MSTSQRRYLLKNVGIISSLCCKKTALSVEEYLRKESYINQRMDQANNLSPTCTYDIQIGKLKVNPGIKVNTRT